MCVTGNSVDFEAAADATFEVEIEADDVTEHPHDDKPRPYTCVQCVRNGLERRHI